MKKGILLVLSLVCFGFSGFAQGTTDKKEIEVADKILASYVGKYELSPNAVIDVTKDEKQLYVQLTGQGKLEIFASEENVFFLKVVEATVTFNKDEEGKVISLTLNQNGQSVTGTKIE
jgi:hypothetical protein